MTAIAILRLQRAGFTEEQVEALAEFSEAGAATKSDIARLETAIAGLDHKIDSVRSDLEAKIAGLDGRVAGLDGRVAALEVKVDALADRATAVERAVERVRHELEVKFAEGKAETIKWVVGMGFAQVAMILAVLRLFPSVHP